MAGFRRYDIIEQSSPFFLRETSIFAPTNTTHSLVTHYFPPFMSPEDEELSFALNVFYSPPLTPTLFDLAPSALGLVIDELVQIETTRGVQARRRRGVNELYLRSLCDRVSALEWKFYRLLKGRQEESVDRKYSWMGETEGGVERKCKLTAEIKGDGQKEKKKNGKVGERSYEWEAQFKGKGDAKSTCTWKATIGGSKGKCEDKKKEKKKKTKVTHIVDIEEPSHQGAVILRQAFTSRDGASSRGKKKELSQQEAAMMIQLSFRESQALRTLRELAATKTKLKEIRAMFHNFAYRSHVARDAEERQKFSERIIVFLLTVDATVGVDLTVRSAKKLMVDELEAMLDIVDPPPLGVRSLSLRRTFNMPVWRDSPGDC